MNAARATVLGVESRLKELEETFDVFEQNRLNQKQKFAQRQKMVAEKNREEFTKFVAEAKTRCENSGKPLPSALQLMRSFQSLGGRIGDKNGKEVYRKLLSSD